MGEERDICGPETAKNKLLRPVLITSERMVREYSEIFHHFLVGLADESISVALVYPSGYKVEGLISPLVEVIGHPAIELPFMRYQNRRILLERLAKFKPSILHCLCEDEAGLVRYLSRELDLPYVLSINSLRGHFRRFNISSSQCRRIIVPAASIGRKFLELYPKYAGRIEQINAGTFVEEGGGCFRDSGRVVSMMTICPMDGMVGFENVLGAVRHLAIEGYEFMLVIIGGGRSERQLRRLLAARGISQIVVNVPRLRPMRRVVSAGDIFIHHQAGEAFDALLLEAMSVGMVVAGCKGGVDDLIIDGETGVVFDSSNELSIKGCLQQLLDRRDWARKLTRGARKHLRESYSVSGMVSSILRVYREVGNGIKG